MRPFIDVFWVYLTAGLSLVLTLGTAGHAIIYKRDSRAAVGWVGLIWLAPVIGPLLYILLGINRIRRRAAGRRGGEDPLILCEGFACPVTEAGDGLPDAVRPLADLALLNARLTGQELLAGNAVTPLIDGDAAYPAMLDAIAEAKASVTIATYIFDHDPIGLRFADALGAAVERGVAVRVLIDSVGARYSVPGITHNLRALGVRTAHFMPSSVPWATPYMNLRNHRKILVTDGCTAFTGGMNIRSGHLLTEGTAQQTRDVHFKVEGPVVRQLQAAFTADWRHTTGESLDDAPWFAPPRAAGQIIARAITDGPDRDYNKMRMAFHGALSTAHRTVRIVTPYFLPDATLIGALNTCALRGVEVDIVLPAYNNLRLVAWASMAQMWQILEWGCRVWLSPPPFDHSKLLVVDGTWSLVGSSNWDPRSLRLNFELGLECYDRDLAGQLDRLAEARIAAAAPLTLKAVNARRLPVKLRDGMARLLAPYL